MRVSTLNSFLRSVNLIQERQSSLNETQEQIATGRRILRPSQDPLGASSAMLFRESLARLDQFDRNANAARNRLEYEEGALAAVNRTLNRWRELALRANNATEPPESRAIVANEMKQLLDDLVQIANTKDGNGRYLFAGNRDGNAPVTKTPAGFVYNGDQGQRLVQIGDSRQVFDGDSGADVFFNLRNGNGEFRVTPAASNTGTAYAGATAVVDSSVYDRESYTIRFTSESDYQIVDSVNDVIATGTFQSGESIEFQGLAVELEGEPLGGDEFDVDPSQYQSVFQSVQNVVDALDSSATTPETRAQLTSAINTGINEIDTALSRISEVRTEVGIRLGSIDAQLETNSASSLITQQAIADLEDLDYAEALSRFAQETAVLEATQASFVRARELSLFRFLR